MPARIEYNDSLLSEIIAFRERGLSYTQIAEQIGGDRSSIHAALKRRGLDGIGRVSGGQAIPFDDYLWSNVYPEPNTGCWLWGGRLNRQGYGVWCAGTHGLAHRVIYESMVSAIPTGLHIDHLCRCRCCVNPDHLEAVTPAVNNSRALKYRKLLTHCSRCKRELAGENLYLRPCDGARICRWCNARARSKARQTKRLAVRGPRVVSGEPLQGPIAANG